MSSEKKHNNDRNGFYHLQFIAKHHSHRQCADLSDLSSNSLVSQSEFVRICDKLLDEFARDGYSLAQIDSLHLIPGDDFPQVKLYITEGSRLKLGQINTSDTTLQSKVWLRRDDSLTLIEAVSQAEDILDELTDSGYPFASVGYEAQAVKKTETELKVDLLIRIMPGGYSRIADVEFTGTEITRQDLLRLESRVKRGQLYNRSALWKAAIGLRKLTYIESVDNPRPYQISPGLVKVVFPVREARMNSASGIAAYSQDVDQITGDLDFLFGNIFGSGRELEFRWRGLNPNRRGIYTSYKEPWIFSKPVHIILSLEQWLLELEAPLTKYSIGAEWEPAFGIKLNGNYSLENIGEADSSETIQSTTNWISVGLIIDQLDHTWNYSEGYSARISISRGFRRWKSGDSRTGEVRTDGMEFVKTYPINRFWVSVAEFEFQDISGSDIGTEELLRTGGFGSIRGYAEESVIGRGIAWSSIELRWRPDENAYAGLFTDIGHIYRIDHRITPRNRSLFSFGLTTQFESAAGNISVNMAFASGKPLRNARLHLGVFTKF